VKLYSKLFFAMDGFWYLEAKELVSADMATTCDLWVWDKYARCKLKRLPPLMNIDGSSVR